MGEPATLPGIPPKRRRRRTGVQAELAKTERKLTQATRGMGESAGEMLKAAALQLVAKKLDEVTALLISIGLTPADIPPVPRPASSPPANRRDPLADLEALEAAKFGGGIDANGKPAAQVLPGITCQICGRPAVYKTKRNMTLCITHQPQGIQDDRDDGVRAALAKGFGNQAAKEEVIEIPVGSIQAALGGPEE